MAFGVYVHIPYCLQRCTYCDFATYEAHQILPPSEYVARIKKEIRLKGPSVGPRVVDTVYFGGGTPSLIEPQLLLDIVEEIKEAGFEISPAAEITIEINPATLSPAKIELLIKGGVNRFSVGAQSFDDKLLKSAGRKHNSQETRDTLSLLRQAKVNFSLDILFALPTQTLDGLRRDLDDALSFSPPHVSPYCLTVPETNPMAKNRPLEDVQVEMFNLLEKVLVGAGHRRYEISNFSKPGFESRHNQIYWEDEPYWGVGLSSHSYFKTEPFGMRVWNPKSFNEYIREIDESTVGNWSFEALTDAQSEKLMENQALTDYFHTAFRTQKGLNPALFEKKFQKTLLSVAGKEIRDLLARGLIEIFEGSYHLTQHGILISNFVFEKLTFLASPGILSVS